MHDPGFRRLLFGGSGLAWDGRIWWVRRTSNWSPGWRCCARRTRWQRLPARPSSAMLPLRQTRRCEISQATGKPWCRACKQYWARCAGCGAFEPIYAGTRDAPLCARCCNPDPGFWNRCPVCEQTWQLRTSACQRCSLSRSIADLLSDGTGRVSQDLAPLHHALTAVERPATVQDWLTRRPQARALLSDLGRDQRPLTHEVLDEMPAGKTVAHLRSVLVAVGALPARDERLLKLERWIAGLLQARDDPQQQQRILHGY